MSKCPACNSHIIRSSKRNVCIACSQEWFVPPTPWWHIVLTWAITIIVTLVIMTAFVLWSTNEDVWLAGDSHYEELSK